MERLFFASCHIAALTLLTCSALLLLRRREGNIARVAMATTFIILGVAFASRVTALYAHIGPSSGTDMSVQLLGLFVITTYLIYPVRSIFARRLRGIRISVIYLPLVVYALVWLMIRKVSMNYTLFDISKILSPAGLDILLRIIVFASALTISFVTLHLVLRYSKLPRLRTYAVLIQVFPLFMVAAIIFHRDIFLVGAIYQATSALLAVYLTYQEVFYHAVVVRTHARTYVYPSQAVETHTLEQSNNSRVERPNSDFIVQMCPPKGGSGKYEPQPDLSQIGVQEPEPTPELQPEPTPELESQSESLLWIRLEEYMRCEQPWRNPEIRITDLAHQLNTNRTTLSAEIHAHGYERFYDYIVKYRIEAFCEIIKTDNSGNIKTAFFEVGFRSTSGAFKQFKLIHNMTPRQYIASQDSIKYDT